MKLITKLASCMLLLSTQVGCATSQTSIDALWQQEVRARALDCYNFHSDQRYVIGSGPTWAACQRWAMAKHRQTISAAPSS